jgi:preprotein translocase subunit SecA
MINKIITKIFGDPSEKKVQFYTHEIEKIKLEEKKLENLSLDDIKNKTEQFKEQFK